MCSVYLCSFADSRFRKTLDRLREQANSMKIFKDIYLYNEFNFDDSIKVKFGEILNKDVRGFGFWLWKPYFILRSLGNLQDNDILLYLDAGCHLNSKGYYRFLKYLDIVNKSDSGILLTTFEGSGCLTRKWTKGDLLDFYNVKHDKSIVDAPQRQATILFVRKCDKSLKIIKDWLGVYDSNISLVDDSPSTSGDLEGFIENRYDQSILSILSLLNNCATISVRETQNKSWFFMNSFPIWVRRDKGEVSEDKISRMDIVRDFLYYLKIQLRIFFNEGRLS